MWLNSRACRVLPCESQYTNSQKAKRAELGANTIDQDVFRRAILALTHFWCRSALIRPDDTGLEEVELSAAVHLTLHELELRDLPLGLAIRSR